MPNPITIPDIRAGQPMRAADMQPLIQAARRQTLQPGMFVSGAICVQRPMAFGGGGSSLQKAYATTAITAATSLLEADYGGGTAQLINNQTGVDEGDPIDIDNPGFNAFDVRSLMWLNMSTSPPQIVSVFCDAAPE